MADPAHPAYKVYADKHFFTKKSFGAFTEGLMDTLAEMFGARDKAHRQRAEQQDRAIAELTARLEELESATALMRALKLREDA